jgi:hypothetical protein
MNNTGNNHSFHADPSEIHASKGRYIRDGKAALSIAAVLVIIIAAALFVRYGFAAPALN